MIRHSAADITKCVNMFVRGGAVIVGHFTFYGGFGFPEPFGKIVRHRYRVFRPAKIARDNLDIRA